MKRSQSNEILNYVKTIHFRTENAKNDLFLSASTLAQNIVDRVIANDTTNRFIHCSWTMFEIILAQMMMFKKRVLSHTMTEAEINTFSTMVQERWKGGSFFPRSATIRKNKVSPSIATLPSHVKTMPRTNIESSSKEPNRPLSVLNNDVLEVIAKYALFSQAIDQLQSYIVDAYVLVINDACRTCTNFLQRQVKIHTSSSKKCMEYDATDLMFFKEYPLCQVIYNLLMQLRCMEKIQHQFLVSNNLTQFFINDNSWIKPSIWSRIQTLCTTFFKSMTCNEDAFIFWQKKQRTPAEQHIKRIVQTFLSYISALWHALCKPFFQNKNIYDSLLSDHSFVDVVCRYALLYPGKMRWFLLHGLVPLGPSHVMFEAQNSNTFVRYGWFNSKNREKLRILVDNLQSTDFIVQVARNENLIFNVCTLGTQVEQLFYTYKQSLPSPNPKKGHVYMYIYSLSDHETKKYMLLQKSNFHNFCTNPASYTWVHFISDNLRKALESGQITNGMPYPTPPYRIGPFHERDTKISTKIFQNQIQYSPIFLVDIYTPLDTEQACFDHVYGSVFSSIVA